MYASKPKRLCVRAAQTEETRVQHHHPTIQTSAITGRRQSPRNHQSSKQQVSNLREDQQGVSQAGPNILRPTPHSTLDITAQMTSSVVINSNAAMTNSNGPQTSESISASDNLDPLKATLNPPSKQQHVATNFSEPESSKSNSNNNNNNNNLETTLLPSVRSDHAGLEQELISRLARETSDAAKLKLLISIRNHVTACNNKKDSVISSPDFAKVVAVLNDQDTNLALKTQLVLLICTLAKGGEYVVLKLNDLSIDQKIYDLIAQQCPLHGTCRPDECSNEQELLEACFRCLRSLMSWPNASRGWILYDSDEQVATGFNQKIANIEVDQLKLKRLSSIMLYAQKSQSFITQESVANLLATTCDRGKDQNLLVKASAISCISELLDSPSERVVRAALRWLSQLCLRNQYVSMQVIQAKCPSGPKVLDKLTYLMSKDMYPELQLFSAGCFAHICRAINSDLVMKDPRLSTHVLQTLVRLVHKSWPAEIRVKAAECIAYLIEDEQRLQSTASICDHLIDSLANMLEYEEEAVIYDPRDDTVHQKDQERASLRGHLWRNRQVSFSASTSVDRAQFMADDLDMSLDLSTSDCDSDIGSDMKRAAFLALASLASNLEVVRKKISNTSPVIHQLMRSLNHNNPRTIRAVLNCLLSLSRSVKQLRTSFTDNSIYSSLKSLLFSSFNSTSAHSRDILVLVIAILCNITLDFSPGRQHFIDAKSIEIFCCMTKRPERILRLQGVWILMNLAYEIGEANLKIRILQALDMPYILLLLQSDEEDEVILKTLGFLRNLMSHQQQVDAMMKTNGDTIIEALVQLLNSNHQSIVKEQVMCVLANVADGPESKGFIMANEGILHHLAEMLAEYNYGGTKLAALDCIRNLALKEYEGSNVRREELRRRGFEDRLKSLLVSDDPAVVSRAQRAYIQFTTSVEDQYAKRIPQ